jgi:hypothetical protein
MSPAEREARAQKFVNRTWSKVAPLYGAAGQAAPMPQFGPAAGEHSGITMGAGGPVTLNRTVMRWLAKPKILDPAARSEAREVLMHEWAHHFQDPSLVADANPNHREEAAQLFATYWGHKLFGAAPMGGGAPPPYFNRPKSSADLAGTYGKGYWRQRQFQAY